MRIILFALLFTISTFVSAQRKFEMGATLGTEVNFVSSFNPQNTKSYHPLPGFNVGLRFRHNFNMHFSLVGGIEFGRLYFRSNLTNLIDPYISPGGPIYTYIINQVRLPILFQVNVGKTKSTFFTNIGPSFIYSFPDGAGYSFPYHIVQEFNIGGMLSAGYSYKPVDFLRLFSDIRFTVPILAIPIYATDLTNTTRTLSLSWQFGISFLMKQPRKVF